MSSQFSLRTRRNEFGQRRGLFTGFDHWLNGAVIGLLGLGIALVYSSTRQWFASNGLDPQYYLKRHIINIIIGLLLAFGTTLVDYRLLRAYTPFVWGLGVIGLIIVLIPQLGSEVNGARAWISLPGGFQIQPAELAKISVIIGIAMILAEKYDHNSYPSNSDVMKALLVAAVPMLLIVAQPDLGTTIIISASVVTIIAVSGAPTR